MRGGRRLAAGDDLSIYKTYEYEYLYPFCPCKKSQCNRDELLKSHYDDREIDGAVRHINTIHHC